MCWNASVSLNTYIFGVFASLFSYFNKNVNGITSTQSLIFYQSFIIMQLIEYFIWSKTFSNRLLSQIAFLVIFLQPIFNITQINSRPELIPYLLFAYIVFVGILYTLIIPLNTVDFSTVPSKNGHLSWNWLNVNIYIIFIWHAFLSSRWIIDKMYLQFIFTTVFLIATLILYKDTNTWGSLWCWIVNLVSIYLVLSVFYDELCI